MKVQPFLDGATGTELNRRGVDTGLPMWSANALLEAPGTLLEVHRDYCDAGAEIVTANTFRTHARSLVAAGCDADAAALSQQAVHIAREAACSGHGADRVFVAGSLAPLEDCYSPDLVPADPELALEHGQMARHLAAAGVDLILVETMNAIREAVIAAEAAAATGLPTLVGLVCGPDGQLLSGESVGAAARALDAVAIDGLMINCTAAPHLGGPLAELADASARSVGAYANVGYVDKQQGWVNTDSVEPDGYAEYAREWLDLGARVVGSCCGTGPAHTRALRRLIDERAG